MTVNGEVAVLGAPGRRASTDVVAVDGVPVGVAPGLVHYLLNKPAGVVTTAADPHGRPTVVDLVPARAPGVPRRPPRPRHRGPAAAHQRRRPHPPPDPPVASGWRRSTWPRSRATPAPGRPAPPARGRRARRRPHRAGQGRRSLGARTCCASPSTRAATARSAACARPSAIPCVRLVRTRIGPLADRTLEPGGVAAAHPGRGAGPGTGRHRRGPGRNRVRDAG